MLTLEGEGMKKKTTPSRLVAFLYLLLRDEVPAERLKPIIRYLSKPLGDHVEEIKGGKTMLFGNGYVLEDDRLAIQALHTAEGLIGEGWAGGLEEEEICNERQIVDRYEKENDKR
jgi:hypothetical protein